MNTLYFVVPCYNEQEVLPETSKRLLAKLMDMISRGMVAENSRILFVNDGSKDATWSIIEHLHEQDEHYSGLKLSRNKGHQNAVLAGLTYAAKYADITISLDADLQDDIDAVDKFVEEYHKGADIVYGVRSARETDTAFKRITAEGFYKVLEAFGIEIVYNHADYRLMSKRAVEALLDFKEVNLFLRGIVPLIGFKTAKVEYERHERFAGESKYPLKKMLNLAIDGITSFSIKPIRFITAAGVVTLGISAIFFIWMIINSIIWGLNAFLLLLFSMWFLSGIILISLGVVGEYVGRMYMETKARPRFFIDKFLNKD